MAAQMEPLKAFKCSYDDCFRSFDTKEEMRAHLTTSGAHPFYCGKTLSKVKLDRGFVQCDFHGKTWEDLVTHKAETMLPWLVGERRFEKPKKFNHIVCEFCGIDFQSLSARELHRREMHQAEQHVVCKGYMDVRDVEGNLVRQRCGLIFGRASQLIRHIESGWCPYMKPLALQQEREHKHIVKLILNDLDGFKMNMRATPYSAVDTPSKDMDDISGGVAVDLLSSRDSDQSNGPTPLGPHQRLASTSTLRLHTKPNTTQQQWPGYPSSEDDDLTDSMGSFSLDAASDAGSMVGYAQSDMEPAARYARSGDEDSIIDSSNGATTDGEEEEDDDTSTPPATPAKLWSTKDTSQRLFGKVKPKAIPNWEGINASHRRSKEEDDESNIFRSRFWDPYHTDFRPKFFYRPAEDNKLAPPYECPFEICRRRFDTPKKIGDHMRESHAAQRKLCPLCLKNFDKPSGLVAHFEASSAGAKCAVARSPGYSAVLFEVTGGLLEAEKTADEPVYGYQLTAAGRDGRPRKVKTKDAEQWDSPGNGVKTYSYRAKSPSRPAFKW